jgi:arabinogalactan endo-1,4-beta-galactosidase
MLAALCLALAAPSPFYAGADVSFLPEYRSLGAKFFDGGKATNPLVSLRDRGVKLLRLRVWVHPPAGFCSIEHTLAMAKEAKSLGMQLLIDFHYSDDWADPQHQTPPAKWKAFDEAEMAQAVYQHTKLTVTKLVEQGTPPDMVQIGNEIRDGMIWPMGQISKSGFGPLSRLLRAGIRGAREAAGKRKLPIMIHHDRGAQLRLCKPFYQELQRRGVDFDIIGVSYYPWWHGPLPKLAENLNGLAKTFAKPVMVVETAYPFSLKWNDDTGNFVGEDKQLEPGYPATPEGQAAFLRKVTQIVREVPNGLGIGVVYWAPEYIAHPGMKTPYENLALWDFKGNILPGADALGGKP